jgi:cobalt-zinc-cadmium efflux system protein
MGEHAHHGGHRHAGAAPARLRAVLVLTAAYMVAEVVGGFLANSLALLADAGHMLADVAALALGVFASWVTRRPPTSERTYGYYRAEILAALANGAALLAVAVAIVVEALQRIPNPQSVNGVTMFGVAAGGLCVNVIGMLLLRGARHENLNVHGAWLHVALDAVGSVGAIVAGLLAWGFGWSLADPIASLLLSLLVVYSAWSLLRQAVAVLMEGTPSGIDADEVRGTMLGVQGVRDVHDLHVWTITSGMHSLSAHVAVEEAHQAPRILRELQTMLAKRFGLDHVTLQLESAEAGESVICCSPATHR